jgi:hypothetical protein
MGRQRAKLQPEAVILPPDLDDDEECAGGGIPDDDGWIYLEGKEPKREDEKPKRQPARRRAKGNK